MKTDVGIGKSHFIQKLQPNGHDRGEIAAVFAI